MGFYLALSTNGGARRTQSAVSFSSSRIHSSSPDVRVITAGIPLPLIPVVRRALDEAGQDTYDLDMIVCTDDMLDRNVSFVLAETPRIDWLAPAPDDWTELNVPPTLLFTSNIHRVSQADIAEVVRSATNGWPVKYGDDSAFGSCTVGEAIARVATARPEKEVDDLIVDYVDDEDEETGDFDQGGEGEGNDDDDYMVSAGDVDVDGTDFSENLYLAIDDLLDRHS
jgi:hypothetical protein